MHEIYIHGFVKAEGNFYSKKKSPYLGQFAPEPYVGPCLKHISCPSALFRMSFPNDTPHAHVVNRDPLCVK